LAIRVILALGICKNDNFTIQMCEQIDVSFRMRQVILIGVFLGLFLSNCNSGEIVFSFVFILWYAIVITFVDDLCDIVTYKPVGTL